MDKSDKFTRQQIILYTALMSLMLLVTPFLFNGDIWSIPAWNTPFEFLADGEGYIKLFYIPIFSLPIAGIVAFMIANRSTTKLNKRALLFLGLLLYAAGFGIVLG